MLFFGGRLLLAGLAGGFDWEARRAEATRGPNRYFSRQILPVSCFQELCQPGDEFWMLLPGRLCDGAMTCTVNNDLLAVGEKRGNLVHILDGCFDVPVAVDEDDRYLAVEGTPKVIPDIRAGPDLRCRQQ